MATLKEFEDALRQNGMTTALALLDDLRQRDRATRRAAPARRITGTRMTPEIARRILELHGSTGMTQQEIAFSIGVNQGRVNEVIKRGKWLDGNAASPEARSRDRAVARVKAGAPRDRLQRPAKPRSVAARPIKSQDSKPSPAPLKPTPAGQLSFGGL